jgi:hypothetical protein
MEDVASKKTKLKNTRSGLQVVLSVAQRRPHAFCALIRPSSNDVKKHTFDFQGYVFGGMFLKSVFDPAPSISVFSNPYPRKHTLPVRKISMFSEKQTQPKF